MARGTKLDNQTIYNIMVSYALTKNYAETGRALKIPESTVRKIVKENRNKKEFAEVCALKKEDFAEKSTEIINKGLKLLNKRFDIAIKHEESLDLLIDEIYSSDKEELSQDEKSRLVSKIRVLQVHKIGEITTAIGTLYDKRALAQGESTENVSFILPDEVKQFVR